MGIFFAGRTSTEGPDLSGQGNVRQEENPSLNDERNDNGPEHNDLGEFYLNKIILL